MRFIEDLNWPIVDTGIHMRMDQEKHNHHLRQKRLKLKKELVDHQQGHAQRQIERSYIRFQTIVTFWGKP